VVETLAWPSHSCTFRGCKPKPPKIPSPQLQPRHDRTEPGIEFPVHPHKLRHGTGYELANDGQDTRALQHYLGHRNIQHTTRYTELAADRFKDFWRD
jgi:integrase